MRMENKYEILHNDYIIVNRNIKLYRIMALRDISVNSCYIKKGEMGGYIESYDNLSQYDNSWICYNSKVFGPNSIIKGNSVIHGKSIVFESIIDSNTIITDSSIYYLNIFRSNILNSDTAFLPYRNINKYPIEYYSIIKSKIYNSLLCNGIDIIYANLDNACILSNNDFLSIKGLGGCNKYIIFYREGYNRIRNHEWFIYDSNGAVVLTKNIENSKFNRDIIVYTEFFNGSFKKFRELMNAIHKNNRQYKYKKEYKKMIKMVKIHFNY